MKPAYFHGHPGAANEMALAGLSPTNFASPSKTTTHVIGFSLGGIDALKFAATTPSVARLDLIACPSPLGPVIPDIAGQPVFSAARKGLLSPLTIAQALLLRCAPSFFLKTLFASAPTSEKTAILNIHGDLLHDVFRHALLNERKAYLRAVTTFVDETDQWPFADITCDVHIWQGSADSWVLPDMAETLAEEMPNATLHSIPDLGHYGTLIHALRHIPRNM